MVESLSLDCLVPILKWSSQPYGSKWVHRQALHFLCEEFSQVVTSDVLYELSKEHLLTAIQSDYLQVRSPRRRCVCDWTGCISIDSRDRILSWMGMCNRVLERYSNRLTKLSFNQRFFFF